MTSNHGINALASVLLRPHIFFSFPKNFIIILSRVYNETIHRPAPSWLVSLIGRALHRYRSARVQIPYKPEFFSSFLFATTKVAFFTAMIILHLILHVGVHIYDFRKFKTLYSLCLFLSKKINSLFYKLPWQPYISTLIDMCPFHSTGRKSTYRALIGGFKWWKTGVFWSVFPENSYSENSSVNLSGCRWFIGCSSWRKALDKSLSSW